MASWSMSPLGYVTSCNIAYCYTLSSRRSRTRDRILAAALELMLRRGFRGFGLEEVAQAAVVSRQTVYRYFESRTGLLEALVDYIPEVEGRLNLDGVPAAQILQVITRFNVTYLDRIRGFASLIYSARAEIPEAGAAWRRRMDLLRKGWRNVAERLRQEGVLAEDWSVDDAADLLWSVMSFPVYEYLVVDAGWSATRYEKEIERLVRRAFLTPHQTGPEPGPG